MLRINVSTTANVRDSRLMQKNGPLSSSFTEQKLYLQFVHIIWEELLTYSSSLSLSSLSSNTKTKSKDQFCALQINWYDHCFQGECLFGNSIQSFRPNGGTAYIYIHFY